MKAYLLLSTLLLSNANAIIGNYIDQEDHPEQTCLLKIKKSGICSSTIIHKKYLLTADHCLRGVNVDEVKIECPREIEPVQAEKFKLFGQENDLALIRLKGEIEDTTPMKIASTEQIRNMGNTNFSSTKNYCAFFGYGENNNWYKTISWMKQNPSPLYPSNQYTGHGILNGIISQSLGIDESKAIETYANKVLKKALKNLENGCKNNSTERCLVVKYLFDRQRIETSILTYTRKLDEIKKLEANLNNTISNPNKIAQITGQIQLDLTNEVNYAINNFSPTAQYVKSQSKNESSDYYVTARGVSGVQPGDSGGTFACKVNDPQGYPGLTVGNWVVFGVNSYIERTSVNNQIPYSSFGYASLLNNHNLNLINNYIKINNDEVLVQTKDSILTKTQVEDIKEKIRRNQIQRDATQTRIPGVNYK